VLGKASVSSKGKNTRYGYLYILSIILNLITYSIFWRSRYFFDDEWFNLKVISNFNLSSLISYLITSDVHPPLSYIVNYLTFKITGANEFLLSIPSIVFTGIAIAIAAHLVFIISQSKTAAIFTLVLAAIHPNTLLFGWSIRWYALWTLSAIWTVYLVTRIENTEKNLKLDFVLLTLALTISLYTNYLGLLLIAVVMLFIVFNLIKRKSFRKWNREYTLFSAVLASIIFYLPWIFVMLRQVSYYLDNNQFLTDNFFRTSSLLSYGAYTVFTGVFGAAVYPWNREFLAPAILFTGIILITIIIAIFRKNLLKSLRLFAGDNPLFRQIIFITASIWVLFLLHSLITSNHKARHFTVLSILTVMLIVAFAHYLFRKIQSMEKREIIFPIMLLVSLAAISVIWLGGVFNVYSGKHLHKMGLSDPVEEVLTVISEKAAASEETTYITCLNPVLSYYLLEQEKAADIMVVTPYRSETPKFIREKMLSLSSHSSEKIKNIIVIDTFLGPFLPKKAQYHQALNSIFDHSLSAEPLILLGEDIDYKFKKRLFPAGDLSEWRLKIYILTAQDSFDPKSFKEILSLNSIWDR